MRSSFTILHKKIIFKKIIIFKILTNSSVIYPKLVSIIYPNIKMVLDRAIPEFQHIFIMTELALMPKDLIDIVTIDNQA